MSIADEYMDETIVDDDNDEYLTLEGIKKIPDITIKTQKVNTLLLSEIQWPHVSQASGLLFDIATLMERLYTEGKPELSTAMQYILQEAHESLGKYYTTLPTQTLLPMGENQSLTFKTIDGTWWRSFDTLKIQQNAFAGGQYGQVYRGELSLNMVPDEHDARFCPCETMGERKSMAPVTPNLNDARASQERTPKPHVNSKTQEDLHPRRVTVPCVVKEIHLRSMPITWLCNLGVLVAKFLDNIATGIMPQLIFGLISTVANRPNPSVLQRVNPVQFTADFNVELDNWRAIVNQDSDQKPLVQWQWAHLWYDYIHDATTLREYLPKSFRPTTVDEWPIHPIDLIIDKQFLQQALNTIQTMLENMDDDAYGEDDSQAPLSLAERTALAYCQWKTKNHRMQHIVNMIPESLWTGYYLAREQARTTRMMMTTDESTLSSIVPTYIESLWLYWIQYTFLASWSRLVLLCTQHMITYGTGDPFICVAWAELLNSWSINQLERYRISPAFPILYDAELVVDRQRMEPSHATSRSTRALLDYYASMEHLKILMVIQPLEKTIEEVRRFVPVPQLTNGVKTYPNLPVDRTMTLDRVVSWHGFESPLDTLRRLGFQHYESTQNRHAFTIGAPQKSTFGAYHVKNTNSSTSTPSLTPTPIRHYLSSVDGATNTLAQQIMGLGSAESVLDTILQDDHPNNVMFTRTPHPHLLFKVQYVHHDDHGERTIVPMDIAIPTMGLEWKSVDFGLSTGKVTDLSEESPTSFIINRIQFPTFTTPNVESLSHSALTLIQTLSADKIPADLLSLYNPIAAQMPLANHIFSTRDKLQVTDVMNSAVPPVHAINDSSLILDYWYRDSVTLALTQSIELFALMLLLTGIDFIKTHILHGEWIVAAANSLSIASKNDIKGLLASLNIKQDKVVETLPYPSLSSLSAWNDDQMKPTPNPSPIHQQFQKIFGPILNAETRERTRADTGEITFDLLAWFHVLVIQPEWRETTRALAHLALQGGDYQDFVIPTPVMKTAVQLLYTADSICNRLVHDLKFQMRFGGVAVMDKLLSDEDSARCKWFWSMRRILPLILETYRITPLERQALAEREDCDASYCVTLDLVDSEFIVY